MKTLIMRINRTLVAAFISFSLSAYADNSVNIGGNLTQIFTVGDDLKLESGGLNNIQAVNVVRADSDISVEDGASLEQTLDVGNNKLELIQNGIDGRQAANYIGARGTLDLSGGNVIQKVQNVSDVVIGQSGSNLPMQGMNVIEGGSSVIHSAVHSNALPKEAANAALPTKSQIIKDDLADGAVAVDSRLRPVTLVSKAPKRIRTPTRVTKTICKPMTVDGSDRRLYLMSDDANAIRCFDIAINAPTRPSLSGEHEVGGRDSTTDSDDEEIVLDISDIQQEEKNNPGAADVYIECMIGKLKSPTGNLSKAITLLKRGVKAGLKKLATSPMIGVNHVYCLATIFDWSTPEPHSPQSESCTPTMGGITGCEELRGFYGSPEGIKIWNAFQFTNKCNKECKMTCYFHGKNSRTFDAFMNDTLTVEYLCRHQ